MGAKCLSVVLFEIPEGPFGVASFEHFGLEQLFNMATMIVLTSKGPSEVYISCLESSHCVFLSFLFSSMTGGYQRLSAV